MNSRLKITIFLLFFTLPILASAQIPTSLDLISISAFPATPTPNQSVSVELESFSTDLNGASIVWTVDGKIVTQGVGKKSLDLRAPALGKTMAVSVIIKTVEGREVRKVLSLKSGQVDLVWESEGFVPPFYKGRSTFVI
jgi:hypothetical protein